MDQQELAQIYLISPPAPELSSFPALLADALDAVDVACFRLALASKDEGEIAQIADACREVAHQRDVAIVIDDHAQLVQRLGLDGVHLTSGARLVRSCRKDLGADVIVGSFCGASRHDGMNAGEAGADYVSFGPVTSSALGDGSLAEADLFQWWSEMIEVPVVAEGGLDADLIRSLSHKVDFFGIGQEIWGQDHPVETLQTLAKARI